MRRARELLLSAGGAVASLVVAGSLGLVIVTLGLFDVSASTPHMPLIGKIVHSTMVHSVARGSSKIDPPKSFTTQDIRSGFCQYRKHCEMCHGGPAVGRPHWVNGMNPAPPYLVDARTRWSRGGLFWIVHNGIKMTAMPSWRQTMSDREIWDVVGFLEALPQLPSPTYGEWAAQSSDCQPKNTELDVNLPEPILPVDVVSSSPAEPVERGKP